MKRTNNARTPKYGYKGHTVTAHTVGGKDGWVLNYQYHGSSFVHAEEFTDSEKLSRRIEDLKAGR